MRHHGESDLRAGDGPVRGRAPLVLGALVGTFVLTRLYLHARPYSNFDVAGYNVHHLFTGLVLLAAAGIPLVLSARRTRFLDGCALVFGAGLALCLDEWVYLIATDGSDEAYLLPVSLWGGVVMVGLAAGYVLAIWLSHGGRRGNTSKPGSNPPLEP